MLVAFLIMLREGIEAALIVAIIAGYLRRTGRGDWMPAIWIGIAAAIGLCILLAVGLELAGAEFPQKQQELFEGAVALIAAGMLTSMVLWMRKAARSIKGTLHRSIDDALEGGRRQGLALAVVAFLAVGREGLESVFFLLATVQQDVGAQVPVGAALGLAVAIGIGVAIYQGGARIDLRRFFRWTGVFIIAVAAGLVAAALRSFHEAGLWNYLQAIAFDLTEILPADGVLGTALAGLFGYRDAPAVGEVLVYLAYLVPVLWLFLREPQPARMPVHRPMATGVSDA